ncbi:hypothetical protein P389DRAFT_187175 [Cystobasidium minutum MCA 4210]|uniref:uncharacterized protein n=1 Tax=Cystobasidium minutum MCA 4210 TaxID=1397322 RepID=UPI0034D00FF7|eukprot:jgi/Rhomi1/187175/estExt_fgenesh1_pg.C_1_t10458
MPPKRGGKAPAFPAARVKRIMQQDDDVGKVATASPIVMAKATELFLYEMLNSIEREARAKSTKKVSMYHVKRAVENTPSLDFLKDLVSTIPDPSGADEEYESSEKAPKKRAGGRTKTANGSASGEPSPGPNQTSATASSSSTSASGLKKIKISHGVSGTSSEVASEYTPSTAASASTSAYTLPPMPAPQAQQQTQDSRPNVAIPISSLLSDTTASYSNDNNQTPFGTAATKQEETDAFSRTVDEEDNYDDDEREEVKKNASMQLDAAPKTEDASAPAQAPVPAPTETYKREEDEDYDA